MTQLEDCERWERLLRSELERVLAVFLTEPEVKQALADVGTEDFEKVLGSLREFRSRADTTSQPGETRSWWKEEFDRGYQDGSNGRGCRPTSRPYIDGHKSGEFALIFRKQQEGPLLKPR